MTKDVPVGLVGAGVMGASLAQALLARGIDVVLQDTAPAALEAVTRHIAGADRLARLRRSAAGGPVGQLRCVTSLADLIGCPIVIENVTEDPVVKESLHRELDLVLDASTVVAINTSAIPITSLAQATRHPERVVGAHFMNPVATSSMVEVIRTQFVAPWALQRLNALIASLGKESVEVGDATGFVINRCLMMFINEAAALLEDDVATPQQVDRLFRGCVGHQTGPLRTADIIGIDTIVNTLAVLSRHYGVARFEPSTRLRRMVADGHLGRKSGRGFYVYAEEVA